MYLQSSISSLWLLIRKFTNFRLPLFLSLSLGNWKWYESDEGCFANKPTKFFFTIAVSNKSVLKSGRLQPSALYRAARFANFEGILVYF